MQFSGNNSFSREIETEGFSYRDGYTIREQRSQLSTSSIYVEL